MYKIYEISYKIQCLYNPYRPKHSSNNIIRECAIQRNKVRRSGPKHEPKILTREEWTRINDHLLKSDRLKNAQETRNMCGRVKALTPLKCHRARKGSEVVPEAEPLTSKSRSKEEIINRAKAVLFENKDYARRLLRGLRLSTILQERNGQINFNQRLRYEKEVKEMKMRRELKEDMIKYEEELKTEKLRKLEKMETFRKELDEQVLEKCEKGRRHEEEKAKERVDLLKMTENETALIKEELTALKEKKLKLKRDIENYTRKEKEIKTALKTKEKVEEEKNKIYARVAFEIDKIRRSKEKSRFVVTEKSLPPVKDVALAKSNQDEKLKALLLEREKRKERLLQDLLSGQRTALEERKKREEDCRRERELSGKRRRRKEEADGRRMRREKEEREKVMKDFMKYYTMQWTEKEEEKRKEKQMDMIYVPDFSRENDMILEYCNHILGLAKFSDRPLYPIIAAVNEIKKEFGLECEKRPSYLKSNVPIGN